ncbi:MAG: hypothetical protein KDI74_03690 [Gammaproteobacteria bacterium]|nr:hypothetical protein [Gammaproteobacteria bacterium]HXK55971.1 hypothetical protein [Gammaproteobacteria bacterium]
MLDLLRIRPEFALHFPTDLSLIRRCMHWFSQFGYWFFMCRKYGSVFFGRSVVDLLARDFPVGFAQVFFTRIGLPVTVRV